MTPDVVVSEGGSDRTLSGRMGMTLMQVIHAAGQPGFGECGGSLACATCHVIVDPAWAERLPPPSDDEEAMLDTAFSLKPTSRLACQIVLSTALDGIRVSIP